MNTYKERGKKARIFVIHYAMVCVWLSASQHPSQILMMYADILLSLLLLYIVTLYKVEQANKHQEQVTGCFVCLDL